MRWFREFIFVTFLLVVVRSAKDSKKKSVDGVKRAVESYTYTVPPRYDQSDNTKTKVIVETIKSISPSEYLTSSGGFIGSTFEASTPTGKIPLGSVTFNAFEPDTKKDTTASAASTETSSSSIPKKKSSYKYYVATSSTQKSTYSSGQGSSTSAPASVRTTSAEPVTTLFPTYQINSRSSSVSGEPIDIDKSLRIITTRGKIANGRYTLQKIVKKPTKIEPKLSDSKPEETGFNGYHYDVGSLGGFESKPSGSQGGMMGASYMRSSSPFYNYHVMLD